MCDAKCSNSPRGTVNFIALRDVLTLRFASCFNVAISCISLISTEHYPKTKSKRIPQEPYSMQHCADWDRRKDYHRDKVIS